MIETIPTYEEMCALLASGVNRKGRPINLKTFDRRSIKDLSQLHGDISKREVLLLNHPQTNRVLRCALNVKVLIRNTKERLEYHERRRRFRKNGKIIVLETKPLVETPERRWTISGTRMRGEHAFDAARRETWEEISRWPNAGELVQDPRRNLSDTQHLHPSSVYADLDSLVTTSWFIWSTTRFSHDKYKIIKDGDTEIEIEAVPY